MKHAFLSKVKIVLSLAKYITTNGILSRLIGYVLIGMCVNPGCVSTRDVFFPIYSFDRYQSLPQDG